EREQPCRARAPERNRQRGCSGIEQRHAAGQKGQVERDQPAVPPGLDYKGLGGPIEASEKITETKPEAGKGRAFEPVAKLDVSGIASVEQPHQQAEAHE